METDEKPNPTLQPSINIEDSQETEPSDSLNASSSNALAIIELPKKEDWVIDDENINEDDDDNYLDSFPPGYRFCPLDEELVLYYLKKKIMNQPLPRNRITEVNLYRHNPEMLAEQYKQYGEKEWYFFTPRDKKYRNGTRPNRAAGDGFWKATGADREVKFKGHVVGYKKALVFYRGKPPKGDKTNWIMHEYRVNDPPPCRRVYNDMRLDDWVLCRIYKKSIRIRSRDEVQSPFINHEDANELMRLDFDYNSVADSMDYSNSFMHHQSIPEGSFTSFQQPISDSFLIDSHSFRSFHNPNDDIWIDFVSSHLDFNGVLDNVLSIDSTNIRD